MDFGPDIVASYGGTCSTPIILSTSVHVLQDSRDEASDDELVQPGHKTAATASSAVAPISNALTAMMQAQPLLSSISTPRASVLKQARRSKNVLASKAKSAVSLSKRLEQFTWLMESPIVRDSLRCRYCSEDVVNNSDRLKDHQSSAKHKTAEERFSDIASKRARLEQRIAQLHGDIESNRVQKILRRVEVLRTFLFTGTPIDRISDFESILSHPDQAPMCGPSYLLEHLPILYDQEIDKIKMKLSTEACQSLAIVFDGTCRKGEAVCIMARYITDDWRAEHFLLRFVTAAKSLTGLEIAALVSNTLIKKYSIGPSAVVAFIRDRARVNDTAVRMLQQIVFDHALDVGCLSHTLNNAGIKANTPHLAEFSRAFQSLFVKSSANRLLWRSTTGLSQFHSVSATRWWSTYDLWAQILERWPDVCKMVSSPDFSGTSRVTRDKLRTLLSDPS